jgi:hypothetical protein
MGKRAIFIHQISSSDPLDSYRHFVEEFCSESGVDEKKIYLVGNSSSISPLSDEVFLKCDNSLREFSAWKAALGEMGDFYTEADVLVLSNETIFAHRNFDNAYKYAFIEAAKVIMRLNYPVVAGDLDEIAAPPPYYKSAFGSSISTYLMLVNSSAIKCFDKHFDYEELSSAFEYRKNTKSVLKENNSLLTGEYAEMLEGWCYKKTKYKKWYGYKKLTLENYDSLRLKIFSIVIEHSISQKLVRSGCDLLDVRRFIKRKSMESVFNCLYRVWHSIAIRLRWLLF